MKKRTFALTLAGVLTIGLLSGCGGGNEPTQTPDADNTQTPGDSASAVTLQIGGIGPLTGDAAIYGLATQWGAQVAVDQINALNGPIKLEYNFQDDTNDTETSISAYNNLKDWGMDILYGCTTTAPCIAVAAETNADRYFQLTPSGSSPDITAGKDNAFQMCFTDPNQGVAAADYMKAKDLGTKVAVLYNNGDPYSTGVAQGFIKHAGEIDLDVVTEQTFPSDTNTDFNVQLKACQDAGADLVFMPIYYTPASLVLAQADQMGYKPLFFGADGIDGILAIEGFDTKLTEGMMMMTPFNAAATDERTVTFVKEFKALSNGVDPNQFAADGYDCMYAIYEAAQKAGVTDEMTPEEICDAMIDVFTSGDFKMDGLTGTDMSWQTTGEVSKNPMVVVIKDGAYVTME